MGNCGSCQRKANGPQSVAMGHLPSPPTYAEYTDGGNTEGLTVQGFDFNIEENTKEHHTEDFEMAKRSVDPVLVVRRGQQFTVKITFNRAYDQTKDAICLVFKLTDAKYPNYSQGTMIVLPVTMAGSQAKNQWSASAMLAASDENIIAIQVIPSSDAIIGEWNLDVDTKLKEPSNTSDQNENTAFRYTLKQPIIILFNPWSRYDSVYMDSDKGKKEYVSSDVGLIWRGTHSNIRQTVWNYGQYEENILECCLHVLIKIGNLAPTSRRDPVKIARHVSAVVNVQDDEGVVVGNWTGKYKGGSPPTKWAGSVGVLQKFYKSKKPVKFGQCWVFAGVVTTVCRAIGIPARVVTNFSSAHDTHNSLTVDYFFDEQGNGIDKLNIDSVWNFHVWNELWMDRPDLEPGGYGGWQAIDATPQEQSDGLYRCGPASMKAIKRGEVMKNYDVPFLFSEVNADKVYWRFTGPNEPLKLITKKDQEIGKFISTKAVGTFDREDLTNSYKFTERSREERDVMIRALRQSANMFSRYYLNDDFEDVQFDFQLKDDIIIGSDFTVRLSMKNKNNEGKKYSVKVILRAATMLYNGHVKNLVKKQIFNINIPSKSSEVSEMQVSYKDYEKCLVDQGAFHISAVCKVIDTGFDYFGQDDLRVKKPDVDMEVNGDVSENKPFTINCSFVNPLPKKLTKGYYMIEGPGLSQPAKINVKGAVNPGEECKVSFEMTPKTAGTKYAIAKFVSKELDDVEGHKEILVGRRAA